MTPSSSRRAGAGASGAESLGLWERPSGREGLWALALTACALLLDQGSRWVDQPPSPHSDAWYYGPHPQSGWALGITAALFFMPFLLGLLVRMRVSLPVALAWGVFEAVRLARDLRRGNVHPDLRGAWPLHELFVVGGLTAFLVLAPAVAGAVVRIAAQAFIHRRASRRNAALRVP